MSIVVGVDYSDTAGLAVTQAFELAAQRQGSEIHIVHVAHAYGALIQSEVPGDPQGLRNLTIEEASGQLRDYVQGYLNHFRGESQLGPEHKVVSHIRLQEAAEEVAQLASDLEADLIVVGTHGRRGLRRILLGSTAEAVVRLASCPVLVVRPKGSPDLAVPELTPACPLCIEARRKSEGQELWCEQHKERHGRRHTYHHGDRHSASKDMPLVSPMPH